MKQQHETQCCKAVFGRLSWSCLSLATNYYQLQEANGLPAPLFLKLHHLPRYPVVCHYLQKGESKQLNNNSKNLNFTNLEVYTMKQTITFGSATIGFHFQLGVYARANVSKCGVPSSSLALSALSQKLATSTRACTIPPLSPVALCSAVPDFIPCLREAKACSNSL